MVVVAISGFLLLQSNYIYSNHLIIYPFIFFNIFYFKTRLADPGCSWLFHSRNQTCWLPWWRFRLVSWSSFPNWDWYRWIGPEIWGGLFQLWRILHELWCSSFCFNARIQQQNDEGQFYATCKCFFSVNSIEIFATNYLLKYLHVLKEFLKYLSIPLKIGLFRGSQIFTKDLVWSRSNTRCPRSSWLKTPYSRYSRDFTLWKKFR